MLLVTCHVTSLSANADEELKHIDAEHALAHAGEHVVVTMTVNASRLLRDRDIGFLNSHKDYMHDDNFTVVLYERVLDHFAEASHKSSSSRRRTSRSSARSQTIAVMTRKVSI